MEKAGAGAATLACIPALILGAFVGHLPWFLLAAVTGLLIWHFWNLIAPVVVAVGGPQHDPAAGPRQLGAAAVRLCTRCSCETKSAAASWASLIKRFRSGAESLPDAVVLTTEEGGYFLV